MKYKSLESQATYQKDIGAFYGVNRTNKINDYQVSECSNMDCGSFPYFSTRGKRELFSNGEKMAILCSDTDITDEYAVTGVTEDGGFIYRGEKVLDSGVPVVGSVTEFLGDYVLLPSQKIITVTHLLQNGKVVSSAELKSFPTQEEEFSRGMYGAFSTSERREYLGNCLCVENNKLYYKYFGSTEKGFIAFCEYAKEWTVGSFFKLKLFSAKGEYSPGATYVKDGEEFYVCDIPDDVYMVVDEVYGYDQKGNKITQSELDSSGSDISDAVYVRFTARRLSGELYDISQHFRAFAAFEREISEVKVFYCGLADSDIPSGPSYFNDCYIRPIGNVVGLGEDFGGRFFACDNLGIDIYYSSGSSDVDKKYDFTAGGAGFVSCGDPGKWTAMCVYGGALYAFKKNGMYRIYSPDGLSFYMERVADVGALSEKCVCVVSDVMYFLSETGLYKFTGTYPTELPDNYGKKYTDGVLGGVDNKVYCSVKSPDGNELLVYDAEVNAYGVHDKFYSGGFVTYGGRLYALDKEDGFVYEITDERESVDFSFDTRKFFLGFTKKAINGIRLYFDFSGGEGEFFEVLVSYDGGEFERCFAPVTNGKLKYIPIKFKKCDEMVLRVAGRGVFTLKGMSLSLYSGGDIKQNR